MITRFYANNYRCLTAFEMRFDPLAVFCGVNGSGKSSVFDAIKLVCDLASGRCFLGGVADSGGRTVSTLEFTNWLESKTQEFELDIKAEDHDFQYVIHLEQAEHYEPRIIAEKAVCDGRELYTRDLEGVHFDGGRSGFPLDWRQAALASIQPASGRREIECLQRTLASILILRPGIRGIESESKAESRFPNFDLSNVISWYRHLAQDQHYTDMLRESLQAVWPDLKFLKLADAGMSFKALELHFEGVVLPFNQLSDGEKMLVSLYLIHTSLAQGNGSSALIDEPDNYVSLQELQPWLLGVSGLIDEAHQALIISHNPEIIALNPSAGVLFWRDNHRSPTRTGNLDIPPGMTAGEALTRGWVRAGTEE